MFDNYGRRMPANRSTRRMKKGFLLIPLLMVISGTLLPSLTFAQEGTITDDAYYPRLTKDKDYNAEVLTVNGGTSTAAFIRFRLNTSLPPDTPGSHVGKATLKLYASGVTTAGSFNIHRVTSSWNEAGTAAPTYAPTPLTPAPISVTKADSFITIDLTAQVQQWLGTDGHGAGGVLNYGIALVPVGNIDVNFDSKETSQTSHQAQLEMVLNHAETADEATHAQNADNATYATTAGTANALASSVTVSGSQITGTVATANGGTGLASSGVAGNFLRSNGSNWTSAPLRASEIPGGSGSYIQNTTAQQTNSNFNISGNGAVGGNLTANSVTASTQYNIGSNRVLSTPGGENFFAGVNAGSSNTSGVHNAFFGPAAGRDNTVGYENSFFGYATGLSNTAGVFNSFFGSLAGISNTTGGSNAFFGANAGRLNTTGGGNASFGHRAGESNTTGNSNTFFGDNAGLSNTTEHNNTFIGAFSNGAAGLTNATAIGHRAQVTQANSLVLGSINGVNGATAGTNVGIGTSAPQSKLHVAGTGQFDGNVTINGNLTVTGSTNTNNGGVPVGAVVAFAGPVANIPAGWAVCDGTAISRTGEYASLFAAIGTAWGAGDGSTTFNIPDLRGMFLRGIDGGAGADPDSAERTAAKTGGNTGDAVGSVQADQYRLHNHGVNDPGHSHSAKNSHKFAVWHSNGNHDFSEGAVAAYQFNGIATPLMNNTAGAATGISIAQSGGNESRPRNAYVYYIIKVSGDKVGPPSNQK